jgi:hypothetical protein
MINKGPVRWLAEGDAIGQAYFIESLFGIELYTLIIYTVSPTFKVVDIGAPRTRNRKRREQERLFL